jgi:hypothetical protein
MSEIETDESSNESTSSYRRQVKIAVIFYAIIEAFALAIFIYKFSR